MLWVKNDLVGTLNVAGCLLVADAANFLALRSLHMLLDVIKEFSFSRQVDHGLSCVGLRAHFLALLLFLQVFLFLELFLLKVLHEDLVLFCKRRDCGWRGCQGGNTRHLSRSRV